MSCTLRLIVTAIVVSSSSFAQGTLSGPTLGFVVDSDSKGIRPILGIPGAATLGGPLDLGTNVVKAAVSPQQNYVLAFSTDASLLLTRFDGGTIMTDVHNDFSTVPDLIAISPSGTSAAFFYRQTSQIQVLTGLPKALARGAQIDISGLPNSLDTLAISDDGQAVLADFVENTTPGSQTAEVFLISGNGTAPRSILILGHAASISFLNSTQGNQSNDALVADDLQNALYLITDAAGAAAVNQVFGSSAQINGPFAVKPSPDNQRYFVTARSGTVVIIDANGADPVTLNCSCTPTGLHRLNGPVSFQLTETSDGIIWILDWDPMNPRFVFVPPVSIATAVTAQ